MLGCLVPLLIYPLVILFFCWAWRRRRWLPCFAENYSELVNYQREKKNGDSLNIQRDEESQQLISSANAGECCDTPTMSAEDASKELSFFTWLTLTLGMDDDKLRDQAGCDAVILVGLVKRMIMLFAFYMIFVMAPLFVLYPTYNIDDDIPSTELSKYRDEWADAIAITSIQLASRGGSATGRFYVVAALVWVIAIGVLWLLSSMSKLTTRERLLWLEGLPFPIGNGLIYQQLPLQNATQEDCEKYLETIFPNKMHAIHMCREPGHKFRHLYKRYDAVYRTYKTALMLEGLPISTPPEDVYVPTAEEEKMMSDFKNEKKLHKQHTKELKKQQHSEDENNNNDENEKNGQGDEEEVMHKPVKPKLSRHQKQAKRLVQIKCQMKQIWDDEKLDLKMCEPMDYPSVVVTFKSRVDQICASTATLEACPKTPVTWLASSPTDVRYHDLARHEHREKSKKIGYFWVIAIFIGFLPLTMAIYWITNPKNIEKALPFLDNIRDSGSMGKWAVDFIEQLLPAAVLNLIIDLMLIVFSALGEAFVPFPTNIKLNLWASKLYFWFKFVFVVMGTLVAKIFWTVQDDWSKIDDIKELTLVLWAQAPSAAVFGIVLLCALISFSSFTYLLDIGRFLMFMFWKWHASAEYAFEKTAVRNLHPRVVFRTMSEMYVNVMFAFAMCITFSIITPLIIPTVILFMLALYPIIKFVFFARLPKKGRYTNSGGVLWLQCEHYIMYIMLFFFVFMILISWLRWQQTSYDENSPDLTDIEKRWMNQGKDQTDLNSVAMLIICAVAPIFFFPAAGSIIRGDNFANLPLNDAIKRAASDKEWGISKSDFTAQEHRFCQPEIDLMRNGIADDYVKTHSNKVMEAGVLEKVFSKKKGLEDQDVSPEESAQSNSKSNLKATNAPSGTIVSGVEIQNENWSVAAHDGVARTETEINHEAKVDLNDYNEYPALTPPKP